MEGLSGHLRRPTHEEKQSKMGRSAPMNRLAEPKEIVAMMLMMLSPANTYMTGQCIAIDGGVSAA